MDVKKDIEFLTEILKKLSKAESQPRYYEEVKSMLQDWKRELQSSTTSTTRPCKHCGK